MDLAIVILAAGAGKRMRSNKPKVLQPLAGRPLIRYVLNAAQSLTDQIYIIYGHAGSELQNNLNDFTGIWVEQKEQLGTGHAVSQLSQYLSRHKRILVLCGDVPLIPLANLETLVHKTADDDIGLLTSKVDNPFGYGRIIRNQFNSIIEIKEEKDASNTEKSINEINTGIFLFPTEFLISALPKLTNNNKQKEYYLTDLVEIAINEKRKVTSVDVNEKFIQGVNNKTQLAELERTYQNIEVNRLLEQGVTVIDPSRLDIRGEVHIGTDTVIDVNVIFEGQVTIGQNCFVGPFCYLKNVTIADNVTINSHSVVENSTIGLDSQVGPFARIRPNTVLGDNTKVGNFVEIKNARLGNGAKANHLSYLGDVNIGQKTNIGAGTITCNYDGVNKNKTEIGEYAFIGSNVALVAPVTIGRNTTVGAGSVITRDVPADNLAITRSKQKHIENWVRPVKS